MRTYRLRGTLASCGGFVALVRSPERSSRLDDTLTDWSFSAWAAALDDLFGGCL
jgi:hypothetical protein